MSSLTNILWIGPFLGLFVIIFIVYLNNGKNNPDGSCTNPVIRMFPNIKHYNKYIHDNSPPSKLYYIPTYNNSGYCLDGSNPAFYYRIGSDSGTTKYQIFFEGGGFCLSESKCFKRMETKSGSSNTYKDYAWFNNEYLSTDQNVNKLSYNYNTIFVRYCDGMTYLANKQKITVFKQKRIHFQGFKILNNLFHYLFTENNEFNLNNATDIILSGCSAGGLSILYHIDYIYSNYIKQIKLQNNELRYMGLIESGFFRMVHQNTAKLLVWLYENMNIKASLNTKCVEYYSQDDVCFADDIDCNSSKDDHEVYKCLFLEYLMEFIDDNEYKLFLLQSRYDFNYNNKDKNKEIEMYNKMGEEYTSYIMNEFLLDNNNINKMNRGVFITSCKHHCGEFGNIIIDNYTANEAIYEFYYSEENNAKRNVWFQNEMHPCDHCCFIPKGSKRKPAKVYDCSLSE